MIVDTFSIVRVLFNLTAAFSGSDFIIASQVSNGPPNALVTTALHQPGTDFTFLIKRIY